MEIKMDDSDEGAGKTRSDPKHEMHTERLINDTYKFIYNYQKVELNKDIDKINIMFNKQPGNFKSEELGLNLRKHNNQQERIAE